MSPKTAAPSAPRVHFLYLGTYYQSTDGKPSVMLREVPDDWAEAPPMIDPTDFTNNVRWFKLKDMTKYLRGASAGSVWSIEASDTTIVPSSARCVGRWPTTEIALQLQANDTIRERDYLAAKTSTNTAEREELLEALEPIRQAYRRSIGRNRVQLLARIIAYITG